MQYIHKEYFQTKIGRKKQEYSISAGKISLL